METMEAELKQTARFLLTEIKHIQRNPALRQQVEEVEADVQALADRLLQPPAPAPAPAPLAGEAARAAIRPVVQDLLVETLERQGEVIANAVGQMTEEMRRLEVTGSGLQLHSCLELVPAVLPAVTVS